MSTPQEPPPQAGTNRPNVAQRLAQSIDRAKRMGFEVRLVVLEGQSPGWCSVGHRRLIFLDLASTTSEQFAQLDAILSSYQAHGTASEAA